MKKTGLIFLLVLYFCSGISVAKLPFGKSYALVIGVDVYPEAGLTTLDYAPKDAQNMAAYLSSQGFEVKKFIGAQANKHNILSFLEDDLAFKIRPEDRFVFFFSGHGVTKQVGGNDKGYIVPSDGKKNAPSSWISMTKLREMSENLGEAKHQLFLFDSCFGGAFAVKSLATSISPGARNYIQRISDNKARQYLTAGGANEQVSAGGENGMSMFTAQLLKALQGEADTTTDGFITISEIAAYMQTAASTIHSTPVSGNFRGHANGDFLFTSPLAVTDRHDNNLGQEGGTKGENNPASATVTDAFGKTYPTVRLADRTWLQSNLDYNIENQSWCYDNLYRNCTDYGRLYTWAAAKQACSSLGVGWRLPTDQDWQALVNQYGGYINVGQENAQTARKAQIALSPNGESGFNLQFGGGRYSNDANGFQFINAHGKYWSSTQHSEHSAWYMAFVGEVQRHPDPVSYGYSVRCLKD